MRDGRAKLEGDWGRVGKALSNSFVTQFPILHSPIPSLQAWLCVSLCSISLSLTQLSLITARVQDTTLVVVLVWLPWT